MFEEVLPSIESSHSRVKIDGFWYTVPARLVYFVRAAEAEIDKLPDFALAIAAHQRDPIVLTTPT